MANLLKKVLDWKAVQSWADGRFSLTTHNHDDRYLRNVNISTDDFEPDWSKIQKVIFSWGNRVVAPIIHQLVPGTWIATIQGCGGEDPIISFIGATNPNYLLGATARTANQGVGSANATFYKNSSYSPDLTKVLVFSSRNNKTGHEILNTHIVPGDSTYIKLQAIAQCTNHPMRLYFVPDKIASSYNPYYRIVGVGDRFIYANYNDVFLKQLHTLYPQVLSGDWKSNFTGTTAKYSDDRDLSWGVMFGIAANDTWNWCYPTYIPPTPMLKTNSAFKYAFIGLSRVWNMTWNNGSKHLMWYTNDSDGLPYGGANIGTLSEDENYSWNFYQYENNGKINNKTWKIKLYDMTDIS